MQEEKGLILSNKRIAKDTYRMEIQASIAKDMKPGQFVNVAVEGFMLRRPISICSVEDKTRFVIIYKVVGDGTAKLLRCARRNHRCVWSPWQQLSDS
ncbi:MAG: hypothetical protein ACLUOD_14380 [[Clostridium] innocuum]